MEVNFFNKQFHRKLNDLSYSEINNLLDSIRYNFKKQTDSYGKTVFDYHTKYFDIYTRLIKSLKEFLFIEHDGEKYINAHEFYELNELSEDLSIPMVLQELLTKISTKKQNKININ